MSLSKEGRIGLGASTAFAILLILINPENPIMRVVLLAALAYSLFVWFKELDWVSGNTEELSIVGGVTVDREPSTTRLYGMILMVILFVIVVGVLSWPVKKNVASVPSVATLIPRVTPPAGGIITNPNPRLVAPEKSGNEGTNAPTPQPETSKPLPPKIQKTNPSPQVVDRNALLRDTTLDLVRKLREMQKAWDDEDKRIDRMDNMTTQDRLALRSDAGRSYDYQFQQLRTQAQLLRRQLLIELPPQEPNRDVDDILSIGMLTGPYPLYQLADYLDFLAQLLPQK